MWDITVYYKKPLNPEKFQNCSNFRIIEHGYFMIIQEDGEIHYISPYNVYDIQVKKAEK